jgi:hypothetical protein
MYIADVEETRELPDVPQDAALLEYLREQASPPSGPDGYALGTDWLAARIDQLPPGVEIEDDLPPEWLSLPVTAGTSSARCKTGSRRATSAHAAQAGRRSPRPRCQPCHNVGRT